MHIHLNIEQPTACDSSLCILCVYAPNINRLFNASVLHLQEKVNLCKGSSQTNSGYAQMWGKMVGIKGSVGANLNSLFNLDYFKIGRVSRLSDVYAQAHTYMLFIICLL